MCDGTMPIIPKVRNLYTDEEWNDILCERKKMYSRIKGYHKGIR